MNRITSSIFHPETSHSITNTPASSSLPTYRSPAITHISLVTMAIYTAITISIASISWIRSLKLHPKERAVIAGSSTGSSLELAAIPIIATFFGPLALQAALLCSFVNLLATNFASFLLFSSAGPAFPENFRHDDGGSYSGEWKGMLKEGFGVYSYPSGARYEGEWRDGRKEGRGVYHFPKGGVYEGEWRGGAMSGTGIRTYSSGRVASGVWSKGKLDSSLEEWQCILAAEGANEAAKIARRAVQRSGTAAAVRKLISQPATWAFAASGALMLTQRSLTPTISMISERLAGVHALLALISLGMTMELSSVKSKNVRRHSVSCNIPSLIFDCYLCFI